MKATNESDSQSPKRPVVALEEHFASREVVSAWSRLSASDRDLSFDASTLGDSGRRLLEIGDERIASMDADGVDVQVISHTAPGVQGLSAAEARTLQIVANDELAAHVAQNRDRFQAFAILATPDPAAAAAELERSVLDLGFQGAMLFGRSGNENLDLTKFWPIFEAAEQLNVPLYLHPQSPQHAVQRALYSGFGDSIDAGFASHGIGWHYETGVQLLRLMLAGVFDRFPRLQVIVGHWGEVAMFFLERMEHIAAAAGLPYSLHDYMRRNVHITPSGMFSERYLQWTLDVVGIERVMFSTDYPFHIGDVRPFLSSSRLTDVQRTRISSANWNQLTKASRARQ